MRFRDQFDPELPVSRLIELGYRVYPFKSTRVFLAYPDFFRKKYKLDIRVSENLVFVKNYYP